AGAAPQSAAVQARRCARAAWASFASQAARNAARSLAGSDESWRGLSDARVDEDGGGTAKRGRSPRAGPGVARERRDHSQAARVASHATARPMLIRSHCEGELTDVGFGAIAAGGLCSGERACAALGPGAAPAATVGGTVRPAGVGAAAAGAAAVPGAGRMVSVRAGRVAARSWLVCVSHHFTVSAGIV